MNPWKQALREGMVSGGLASIASTVALAVAGRRENKRTAAPVNAISHWIWGNPALAKNAMTWRYTAAGYLVHHAASLFWATLHARVWANAQQERTPAANAISSTATAAVACLVDFRLTPHRLTPGFQHRLSRPAIALVYGCFALGLALGSRKGAARRRHLSAPGGTSVTGARRSSAN